MLDPSSKTSADPDKNREVEGNLEIEAPAGTGDKAKKARDSAFLDKSYRNTVAMAEVMAPGIRFSAYDRAQLPGKTLLAIDGIRKDALRRAHTADADLRGPIDAAAGGDFSGKVAKMKIADTRTVFESVAQLARARNNAGGARTTDSAGPVLTAPGFIPMAGAPRTMGDFQKGLDDFWANEAKRGKGA